MEWLEAIKKAISYIENNLTEDISIDDICKHIGFSSFYFQKGFNIITGFTISTYIRNRKLYLAALDIITDKYKIIDIAFKYGYETPESFTKAYSRFHGMTPKETKTKIKNIKVFLPLKIKIEITGGNTMDYVVESLKEFEVIGFEYEVSYEESYQVIPNYWTEIYKNYIKNLLDDKEPKTDIEKAIIDNGIGEFGVCIDDIGDKKFRYLIAGRYTGGNVPNGMVTYKFPDLDWAKFKAVGPMPGALQSVNTKVFKEWLPGNPDYAIADNFNIEWYSEKGSPKDENYESAVWVPVIKK